MYKNVEVEICPKILENVRVESRTFSGSAELYLFLLVFEYMLLKP